MDNKQATEIVLSIFAQMSSEQRRQLVKVLRAVRRGMDFKYPNGLKVGAQAPSAS